MKDQLLIGHRERKKSINMGSSPFGHTTGSIHNTTQIVQKNANATHTESIDPKASVSFNKAVRVLRFDINQNDGDDPNNTKDGTPQNQIQDPLINGTMQSLNYIAFPNENLQNLRASSNAGFGNQLTINDANINVDLQNTMSILE